MLNGTPVVTVTNLDYYRLPGTQEGALSKASPRGNHKNVIIKRIEKHFCDCFDDLSRVSLVNAWSELNETDKYKEQIKSYWLSQPYHKLQRQLGYHTLSDAQNALTDLDCRIIRDAVQLAENVFCAYPSHESGDGTEKAIRAFRQQVQNIPGIHTLIETSISIRGLIEHEVLLGVNTRIEFEEVPIYIGRIQNWSEFIDGNPQCDTKYLKGYGISIAYILFAYAWHRLKLIRSDSIYKRRMNKDVELPSPVGLIHNQINKLNAGKKIVVINGILAGSVAALQRGVSKLVKSL